MAARVSSEPRSPHPPLEPLRAFDAALAAHPTRRLAVDRLVDPLHLTDAPDVVRVYVSAMRRGDRFPPVCAVRLLGIWFVADGHKRFTAYRSLGAEEILVEVWPVARWLRDQREQAAATARRWKAAMLGRGPGAPRRRDLLAAEIAHLRRVLACLVTRRGAGLR